VPPKDTNQVPGLEDNRYYDNNKILCHHQ